MPDSRSGCLDPVEMARRVRLDVLEMIGAAGSGHPGGSFSAVEILVELFFDRMRIDPADPGRPDRDRFVLSKGHACPALYSVMARRGYFDPSELLTLRKLGSRLQGHPDRLRLPCLDSSSGSLGQGFGVAAGLARGLTMLGLGSRVYCLLGDGELQEGCVWETASCAAHARLANLVAIVDSNGIQLDGRVEDIQSVEPLALRWQSFGWHTVPADGHSFLSLRSALDEAESAGMPSVILARTVKGRGVSFMENTCAWHGGCPDAGQLSEARREIAEGGR